MKDVYNSVEEHKLGKDLNVSIVFGNLIANNTNNKNFYPEGTEFSVKVWKHNISFLFVTKS